MARHVRDDLDALDRRTCAYHRVLFGADSIGAIVGSQRYDLRPDLMTLAKGLTSGYVPMADTSGKRRFQVSDPRVQLFLTGIS